MLHVERILSGPFEENAYLVYLDGRADALAVDPGGPAEPILGAARAAGVGIGAILMTHGHFDHALGAAGLRARTGARLYIHPLDAPMLKSPAPLKLPAEFAARFTPAEPDAPLDGPALWVCGMDITLLHTPGHTPGGVCFYLPGQKTLFTGDTLFRDGYGRTDFAGGSARRLRESLEKLFRLPGDVRVHPGHGESDLLARIRERLP